jgi:hypothetical protein
LHLHLPFSEFFAFARECRTLRRRIKSERTRTVSVGRRGLRANRGVPGVGSRLWAEASVSVLKAGVLGGTPERGCRGTGNLDDSPPNGHTSLEQPSRRTRDATGSVLSCSEPVHFRRTFGHYHGHTARVGTLQRQIHVGMRLPRQGREEATEMPVVTTPGLPAFRRGVGGQVDFPVTSGIE